MARTHRSHHHPAPDNRVLDMGSASSSPPVVVVAGLPGAGAPAWLRSSLGRPGAPVAVLVIERWMPRLFLDDDRLFDAAEVRPNLHESVGHWLVDEAGSVAGEVRRVTAAEVIDRAARAAATGDGRLLVVPGRRVRDRVRRAWLLRRLRRAGRSVTARSAIAGPGRQLAGSASVTEPVRCSWSPTGSR